MESKRRRELGLGALVIVLLAVAVWNMQPTANQPAAPATAVAASANAPAGKNPLADIDLDALEKERPQPGESTRNPFGFRPKPAPAPPTRPVIAQPPVDMTIGSEPMGPPPPPRIELKYIGDMADPLKPGKRIAILSDGRDSFYGREGEVIEGRYQILRIGVESVELAYLDGRGRQTIRQTGQ